MGANAITIYQNRSFAYNLIFETSLGNPFPMDTWVLSFMIKENISDADINALYSSEYPTGIPVFGNLTFFMLPSQTGGLPLGAWNYEIAAQSFDKTQSVTFILDQVTVSPSLRNTF